MWWCKKCQDVKAAEEKWGKPKVRRFPSGFVAVFLECGHTASAVKDRIWGGVTIHLGIDPVEAVDYVALRKAYRH